MRHITLLPLAVALATAVVVPDDATAQQLGLEIERPAAEEAEKTEDTASEWWLPKKSSGETHSSWWDAPHWAAEDALYGVDRENKRAQEELVDLARNDRYVDFDNPYSLPVISDSTGILDPEIGGYGGPHGHHRKSNLTIYQAIQASNYTKKFAALVSDFPDLISLLNSTESNVTLFVPLDKAFEKIPERGHKPPKEIIQKILEYHIVPGFYPGSRVVPAHTLPTALKNKALGGRPQRLRVGFSVRGPTLNFYSRVTVTNFLAQNGVAHAVDSILLPPPPARRLISLFPSKFSTFELAAEKTGLVPHHRDGDDDSHRHHHGHNTTGLTIFAPTNWAFSRLGPAANAFLFNTEKGLGYLRALLKYHVVANHTLYSDAYYGVDGHSETFPPYSAWDDVSGHSTKVDTVHVDLPTLLGDRKLSIDIARWYRLINIRINGYTNVAVQDGVAWDGVVQIVNSILIPPHQRKHEGAWAGEGHISPEELVARLTPYVEEAEKPAAWGEL